MTDSPRISDRTTWLKERKALLVEEKAVTRRLDELARRRRALPWVKIDKTYTFDSTDGRVTLGELFDGRSQLLIYHFMMGPEWAEGCPSCSFWADNFNGVDVHLAARDTTLLAVSRAPLDAIQSYRSRMGWDFTWVSSLGSDFNMDFGVSFPEGHRTDVTYNFVPIDDPMEEAQGLSTFVKDSNGDVFHTYSSYGRGVDIVNGAYQLLDLTPKGRDEGDGIMAWLRRHDSYEPGDQTG
ncbi:MAG: DUF899 domain-containing protein [Actinomycetia bacterium]|nr:DUF899 domain-containing protein [Actinomycetes bacterium]